MGLKVIQEDLNGLILFEPQVFGDSRGFFMESYRSDEFEKLGITTNFKQDNHSKSKKGVLRGMHFQWNDLMGKLIRVTAGAAIVAEVDIRYNSPTVGHYRKYEINSENKRILWVPPGFANGFLSLEDGTEVQYKCTALWNPECEKNIKWNDSQVAIDWEFAKYGIDEPETSDKDKAAQTLQEWLSGEDKKQFFI
jgi:dTDP-4-dehydrorhamnose 3,5-epimerase